MASYIFSLLWLTSAACQFQPDAHYIPPSQLLRKPAHQHHHLVSASGRIMMFFARGIHITIRMMTFTLFVGLFDWMLLVVVAVHALFYFVMLLIYRGHKGLLSRSYKAHPNYRRPMDERVKVNENFSYQINYFMIAFLRNRYFDIYLMIKLRNILVRSRQNPNSYILSAF